MKEKNPWKPEFGKLFGDIFQSRDLLQGNAAIYYDLFQNLGFTRKHSFLSIGCGTGFLETILAKNHGMMGTALDPSPDLTQKFRQTASEHGVTGNIQIEKCRLEDWQTSTKFDLAFAIHSWYYVSEPVQQIRKILNCLVPGAPLFISMTFYDSYTNRSCRNLGRDGDTLGYTDDLMKALDTAQMKFELKERKVETGSGQIDETGCLTDPARRRLAYFLRKSVDEITADELAIEEKFIKDNLDEGTNFEHLGDITIFS